jgi:hypothetical protein
VGTFSWPAAGTTTWPLTYVDRKVKDTKNQKYPPHSSLKWKDRKVRQLYRSDQIFKIVGNSYDLKGNVVQKFYIKCRLV